MKTTKYRNLYQSLKHFNCEYILNNYVENELFQDGDNYEKYEALSDWSYTNERNQSIKRLDYCNLNGQEEFEQLKKEYGGKSLEQLEKEELISDELSEELNGAILDNSLEGCEIYQNFIVDDYTKELLEDYGEFVYYIEKADLNVW